MNKNMGYILIVLGALLIIAGGFMVMGSNKQEGNSAEPQIAYVSDTVVVEKTDTITVSKVEPVEQENQLTDSEQKGREFEEYVVSHFTKKYFTLKEWRSDKYYKGNYAESNLYPDLEYVFTLSKNSYPFAIECKWRSEFKNGWVEWAGEEQADHYRQFEKEKGIPVFVMLGIGGTPSNPEEVYAIPLRVLKHNKAKQDYIEPFKREDVQKNFYYDTEKGELR